MVNFIKELLFFKVKKMNGQEYLDESNPAYLQKLVLRKDSEHGCYQAVYGTPDNPITMRRFDRTSLVLDSLSHICMDIDEEILDIIIEDSFLKPLQPFICGIGKKKFEEQSFEIYDLFLLYGMAKGIKMNLRELQLKLLYTHKNNRKNKLESKLKELNEKERYVDCRNY